MTKITASTEIYGIFGYPARHSMSPIIQNGWIEDFGFNAVYIGLETEPNNFATAVNGLQKIGLKGANITSPFKEDIAKLARFPSDEVSIIGAANTIKAIDEDFASFNTDGAGMVYDINHNFNGFREKTKIITVIGAGGAARGVIKALSFSGVCEIRFVGRTLTKCQELVRIGNLLNQSGPKLSAYSWEEMDKALLNSDLIINATTIGLKNVGSLVLDLSTTSKDAIIYDMVYFPQETDFVKSAKEQNRAAINGMGMLVGQGVLAFEIWFGQKPDFEKGLSRLKAQINA